MADSLLSQLGIEIPGVKDYDDLLPDEQETYKQWLDTVSKAAITLEDIRKHVHEMRQAVEYELAGHEKDDRRDMYLKARLRNYLLLEALFERPDRARDMLKNQGR